MFVISAVEGEKTHKSLKRLGAHEIIVGGLDMWDKADLVRQTLAKHRKSLDESGFGNQVGVSACTVTLVTLIKWKFKKKKNIYFYSFSFSIV